MGEAFITRRGGGAPFTITEVDPTIFNFLNDAYKTFNCPKELALSGQVTGFIVQTNGIYIVSILIKPEKRCLLTAIETGAIDNQAVIEFNVAASTSAAWVFTNGNYTALVGTPTKAYSYVIE